MAWPCYLSFDGTEIINTERTAAYARNDGAHWFIDTYKATDLALVLGDQPYRSPLQDDNVPWVDPDVQETYGFYGLYPLSISGQDDSTRTSSVVENTGNGGNAGRLRHGTRQMVFTVLLLGEDEGAVGAGFSWLKSALLSGSDGGCSSGSCVGATMCFFTQQPAYDPAFGTECADDYLRSILQVTVNSGPTVIERKTTSDGSEVWNVQFTAVANIPWQFGAEQPVMTGFLTTVGNTGNQTEILDVPAPNVAGGDYDDSGSVFTEVPCLQASYTPVFDPGCPDLVLPPVAPPVSIGCFNPPINWSRYTFSIPENMIRQWTDAVPLIQIHQVNSHLRNMRIRFYADPDGSYDPDTNPCGFCADFWISYIPENTTMQIDGRDESVVVISAGQSRRADGLIFDSNHMPFTWPQLSCGVGYKVTFDFLQTQKIPSVDFSLVPKVR